jgi:hypothetical protein
MKEFKIETPNKPTNSPIFFSQTGFNLFTRDNDFYVSGCETQKEADDAIAGHNPPAPIDNLAAKATLLAKLGLTADELKTLLS